MISTNPFVALALTLEQDAQNAWAEIVTVADKFEPLVANDILNFVESLAEIALGAVLQQAPLAIAGTEKFGNAVATVVQTVESQGKTLAVATAQAAVQQAYTAVQTVVANKPKS